MSWFGSTNWETIGGSLAKTAKSALKHAQKNIDKVLEIPEVHVENTDNTPKSENGSSHDRSASPASVKEETDGFFSMFGVASNIISSKSSSRTSLNDEAPRTLQEPVLSRRSSSSSSLSRLRSVDAWSTSELHAVTDSDPSDAATEILLPSIDDANEKEVSVEYLSQDIPNLPPEPVSHKPREKDALEEVLSGESDNLALDVSQGRLEILFHDEESVEDAENSTDVLVDIPLGPRDSDDVAAPQSTSLVENVNLGTGGLADHGLEVEEDAGNSTDVLVDIPLGPRDSDDVAAPQSTSLVENVNLGTEGLANQSLEVEEDAGNSTDVLVDIPLGFRDSADAAAHPSSDLAENVDLSSEMLEKQSLVDISSENRDVFQNNDFMDAPVGVWSDTTDSLIPSDEKLVDNAVPEEKVADIEEVAEEHVSGDSQLEKLSENIFVQPVEETPPEEAALRESDISDNILDALQVETVTDVRNEDAGNAEGAGESGVGEILENGNVQSIQAELESLRLIIAAREKKIADLNSDSVRLKEENDNLKSETAALREAHSESDRQRNELADHFEQLERRLQAANEDKKSLIEQLKLTKNELSNRDRLKNDAAAVSGGQLKDVLRQVEEKDKQIQELLEEGEKLSKQHFQSGNHIKKLRARQTELENDNAKLRSDLDDKQAEVNALKTTLTAAEDVEHKQSAASQQLATSVDRLEKDLLATRTAHEDARAKTAALQTALDAAYKELADLHRQRAVHDGQLHETLLSADIQAKEELRQALDAQKQTLLRDHEELTERVEVLQSSVSRLETVLKRKEESYRDAVADYQHRLQDAVVRNEELSQNLAQATRPLLRHNEILQKQMAEQAATFDKLQQTLTKRLQEATAQLAVAQEKEHTATERLTAGLAKLQALETQMSIVREERQCLSTDLERQSERCRHLDSRVSSLQNELDSVRSTSGAELASVKRDKQLLEHQLALHKENVEMERRKVAGLNEQISELRAAQGPSFSDGGMSPNFGHSPSSVRRSDSMISQLSSATLEPDGRWSPSNSSQVASSLYDVLRGTSGPYLDSVQSQLKLRDGELQHVKKELQQLDAVRLTLSDQLMHSGEKAQEMERLKVEMEGLKGANADINHRYNAMLQMYGEKAEELEELRLDYEDMKALYKSQIDALTRSHKDPLK